MYGHTCHFLLVVEWGAVGGLSLLNSANSVNARSLSIYHVRNCGIGYLATGSDMSGVRTRVHRFGPRLIYVVSSSTTRRLGAGITSLSIGIISNVRNLVRYTICSNTSAILGSIINVVNLRPALRTVGTGGAVTLTGGRALITNNRLIAGLTGRGNISVLPISDRRSTVFRTVRNDPHGRTVGGVVLATSNKPFFNGGLSRLRGIATTSTLGRPG